MDLLFKNEFFFHFHFKKEPTNNKQDFEEDGLAMERVKLWLSEKMDSYISDHVENMKKELNQEADTNWVQCSTCAK